MAKPHRPTGVTILAILEIISGTTMLVLGAVVLALAPFLRIALPPMPRYELLNAIVGFLGAVIAVFGLLSFFIAWGLWTAKTWARILTLIIAVVGLISSLVHLLWGGPSGVGLGGFLTLILQLVIIYYLYRPDVKAYFGK
jgi:hypothetical protein